MEVVHGNLKPENILIKLDENSKIIDVRIADFSQSYTMGNYNNNFDC